MRVKAAVVRAHGATLKIEDLDLDEPRAGEILVRVIASGVSACDREAIAGALSIPLPVVPGCEGAGIVERTGEGVTSPQPGETVLIVGGTRPAGTPRPDAAPPFHGDEGAVQGFFFGQSSFATHLLCPAHLALRVPDDAPLELLAALGREVLLGIGLVLQDLAVEPDTTIVITGGDAIGLGACMAAAAAGCTTIVLADPRESRRSLALTIGASIAVPADDGLGAVLMSLGTEGARYGLETSGAPAARAGCEASLQQTGRLVVVDADSLSRLDMAALMPEVVALVAAGRLPLEKLVTFYPFEQVQDAIAAHGSGAAVKPVLRFSLGSFGDLDRALQEGVAMEEPVSEPVRAPEDAPPADDREAPPVTA